MRSFAIEEPGSPVPALYATLTGSSMKKKSDLESYLGHDREGWTGKFQRGLSSELQAVGPAGPREQGRVHDPSQLHHQLLIPTCCCWWRGQELFLDLHFAPSLQLDSRWLFDPLLRKLHHLLRRSLARTEEKDFFGEKSFPTKFTWKRSPVGGTGA